MRELVAERKRLLDDVSEQERQLMLWAKKTKLEKETQAALDPEVGMAEGRPASGRAHLRRSRRCSKHPAVVISTH